MAPGVGVAFDAFNQARDLVDAASIGRLPVPPLFSVDRTQIAILVRPFIPDRHAVFLQVANVRVALQEPQQFVDDRARVQFLGRQQREAVLQAKAHLPAEHRQRPGAGAVGLVVAVFEHMAHEVEVLAHEAFRQKP